MPGVMPAIAEIGESSELPYAPIQTVAYGTTNSCAPPKTAGPSIYAEPLILLIPSPIAGTTPIPTLSCPPDRTSSKCY